LTESVRGIAAVRPFWTRRRLAGAFALAATIAAVFFGVGWWTGTGDDFQAVRVVSMQPTHAAAGASALLSLGPADEAGNWDLELDVSGLPALPRGGYYVLWLDKGGEYAGTCGTFNVAAGGSATVRMSASYRLADYDGWVVTAWLPNRQDEEMPRLLEAPI
jgi:hypothetical protein